MAEALAVVTLGSVTALRFMMPMLSSVDEGAHIAYVQVVTEQHRLPVLDRDLTTPEVLSLASGSYPRIVGPSRTRGLGAYSYEAFQPPLYHVLAAPVFALAPGDFVHGVYALRLFGVALLLLAFALFGVLCRDIVGERWPLAAALGGEPACAAARGEADPLGGAAEGDGPQRHRDVRASGGRDPR